MIAIKPLADPVSVCSFVGPEALDALTGSFRTIINARPDGEEPGQPPSAAMAYAASRAGLHYVHIPVVPGQIGDDQVAAFARALRVKPGPVLAYCKSGARAASLWALAAAPQYGVEGVLGAAKAAGYDLAALRPRLARAAVA